MAHSGKAARCSRVTSTAIRDVKPQSKDEAKRPEFKVCKYTTEAIITEGSDVGTLHKVCANGQTNGLCYGQKTVDAIVKWTEPVTAGASSQTEVT